MNLYTHASRQGQSCLLARNFPEFVGQLSQLTFYKIDLVTDLHPSVFPIPNQFQEKSEKHYLQFLCTKKKSLEIMTHAIDCFSYHTWWILDSSRKELEVAGCYNVWGTMTRVQWNPASLSQSELTRADIEGLQILLRRIDDQLIS